MQVLNFLLYPVHEIPEQIRRRIAFNASTSSLDNLTEVVARQGHSALGTAEYQSALSSIVGFDGTPTGFERPLIDVSGSDSNPAQFAYNRSDTGIYNFIGVLVANPVNETRTHETRYIITGYTSQVEKSLTGLLPDDMVLYINDIYGMQATYGFNGFNERVVNPNGYRMLDNYVLSQALSTEGYSESTVDIISVAKSADMVKRINLNPGEQFIPTKDTIFSPTASTSANLISNKLTRPDAFVTAMSNGYLKTMGQDDTLSQVDSFFEGTGGVGIEKELSSLGVVRQFANYEFVRAMRSALQKNTGRNSDAWRSVQKARFTLSDLRAGVDNPFHLDNQIQSSLNSAYMRGAANIEKTDEWVGVNGYSTQASLLSFDMAMQLGPIMARSLIGQCRFVFDNRAADFVTPATMQVIPESVGSISGDQLPGVLARQFETDLKQMFITVTKHNQIRASIVVVAMLGTVNRIEVTVDGELMPAFHTYASFMSSRLHMGNTTDLEYAGKLAMDTVGLMKSIEEGYNDHVRRDDPTRLLSNIPTSTNSLLGVDSNLGGSILLNDDGTGKSLLL